MSIVRSLLIKVGFVTDKQTINQTNKAIAGFKTRFAIAASAATYAFSKIVNYFSDIASATLDADLLARSLGISLVEFTKLQKAAESFRIDDKQFSALFQTLNKNITNFRYKLDGELVKLAQAFDFDPTKIKNSAEAFEAIIKKLNSITNDQQRKDFAEYFFPGLGQQLADLSKNIDTFTEKKDSFDEFANELQNSLPALGDYEKAVRGFSDAWKSFVVSIGTDIIPALTSLIDYLKPALELLKTVGKFYTTLFKGDKEGFLANASKGYEQLKPIGNGILSGVGNAASVVKDLAFDKLSHWYESFKEYAENRDYSMMPATSMGAPMVTNNIDIQVGPGTTEQQAQFMSDRIEQQVEASIYNTFQNIQNNNPMVE